MKALDKYLQKVRIKNARRFIRKNDTVLDVGSVDGIMFEQWKGLIKKGFGIDPVLDHKVETDLYTLIPGYFPDVCPEGQTYDAITLLAVLEHIPPEVQNKLAENCHRLLNSKGRVIITVPSPKVDDILAVLLKLKLIDGMSLEEHYGFDPKSTPAIFSTPYFRLIHESHFQLGLNNLFVFEKAD
ncbi:MAG TPA: methyltransferase domain-containing protein [Bacteroidia bacterium]|jgi:2-polyprenyl-3-methyl-5-hydroxy-6-metoxy-1,4-benzoquinol methylase|nr:methyltransferase domain-containing protein [Bacteroidia bacterium]